MRKKSSFILIIFALLLMVGCSSLSKKPLTAEEKQKNFIQEKTKKYDLDKKFYFNQLTDNEKEAYIKMTETAEDFKTQVKVKTLEESSFLKVRQAFTFDNPQYFWSRNVHIGSLDSKNSQMTFTVPKNAKDSLKKMEQISDQIAKKLTQSSDYEKAKYIYDYILKNTSYSAQTEHHEDIRGPLLMKKALSGGYAHTFTYLANKAGLEAFTVIGHLTDKHFEKDNVHLWNGVKIKGKYYWVDPTWGKTSMKTLPEQNPDYSLFCVDDVIMKKMAVPDPTLGVYFNKSTGELAWTFPKFDDNSLEYYRAKGDYFATYDGQKFRKFLIQKIDKSTATISVLFGSAEAYNAAVNDLNGRLVKDLAKHYKGRVDFKGSANRFSYRIDLHFTRS